MHNRRGFSRVRRVQTQILHELAQLLCTDLKDPRIQGVVPTAIDLAPDYTHANIYYVALVNQPCDTIQQVLEGASGYFRSQLSKKMRLFSVPQLRFIYDDSIERGATIDRLLDNIKKDSVVST